jgi:TonB family protein
MRHTLAASLLLLPVLVTAAAAASQPKTDAPVKTQDLQVSSDVTTPQLIHSTPVHISADVFEGTIPSDNKVVVALYVDDDGSAQGVRVVKPVNPQLDARVVAAVRQFRFQPALRNNKPIPVAMNLVVDVQR